MCQKLNAFAMLFLQNVEKPMLLIPFPSFSFLSYIFLPFPNFPSLSSAFFFLLPPSSFLFPRFSLAIVIRNMKCMILGPRATCIYIYIYILIRTESTRAQSPLYCAWVRPSVRPCVRACVSTSVPYFCAQAAYFSHGTSTTLQPIACL